MGKQAAIAVLLHFLVLVPACGTNHTSPQNTMPLTGNWKITLNRHASNTPLNYSGFLIQSGSAVNGSVILGGGCQGVGPVTGTVDNQKVEMTINQFGQDLSLTGDIPTGSGGVLSGEFSTLAGGCTNFPNTGTWLARLVPPLNSKFHGTLTSPSNGTIEVTGTLVQGPNTGGSTATLTGTIDAQPPQPFCAYLTTATMSGVISGTFVTLNVFGPTGVQITQVQGTITPDATALAAQNVIFGTLSNSCLGDNTTLQITFP